MDALGVTDSGFEAGCTPPDSDFQDPQFGVLVTNNRLEWTGVQVPVPGFGDFPEWTTIRLTSMRGNASELGIPDVGNPAFAQIQATVTINGESAITLNTNEANIGLPLLGLISEIDEPASELQCEDDGDHAMLTINEGFPTAFKTIGTASFTISGSVQVENGYPAPDSGTTTALDARHRERPARTGYGSAFGELRSSEHGGNVDRGRRAATAVPRRHRIGSGEHRHGHQVYVDDSVPVCDEPSRV